MIGSNRKLTKFASHGDTKTFGDWLLVMDTQGGVHWDTLGEVYGELEYSFIYIDVLVITGVQTRKNHIVHAVLI